jgi:HD-GYP domain-containing protein (c-di-GMP phosphodiesterase class II)
VLQVTDIYDALTNPRPYKHAFAPARALEVLQEESGRGWRDPEITALFVDLHQRLYCKTAVRDSMAHLREFLTH